MGVDLTLPMPPKFDIGGVEAFVSGDDPYAPGWSRQAWARFVDFYTQSVVVVISVNPISNLAKALVQLGASTALARNDFRAKNLSGA